MTELPDDARPALDMIRDVGGDELVQALLTTFIKYGTTQLTRAREAAAAGDAAEIARVAHAVKSSARQMGANALADACAAAELAGLGNDLAGAIAGVAEIERTFEAARPWMEAHAAG